MPAASAPRSRRSALLALALAAPAAMGLGGCAPAPLARPDAGDRWSGRLSLHVASEPPQGWSGPFELVGDGQHGELRLLGPLGQQMAQLRWAPGRAQLLGGPQGPREFDSVDAVLRELTGAPLPVAALFDWLKGKDTRAGGGWQVDLSQHDRGRILAQRQTPGPAVRLWVLLDGF